jgi:hypothetical protein
MAEDFFLGVLVLFVAFFFLFFKFEFLIGTKGEFHPLFLVSDALVLFL